MEKPFVKTVMARLIGAAAIGGVVVMGAAGLVGQEAVAGVANTKHNLGSTGTGANKFSGTAEICVFCHTPHGADTSAAVPLWNRVLANPATYTTYNSLGTSSLDGGMAAVGSVSIACLSCHDGVQAMNTIINAPGSGLAGDAAWAAGSWGTSTNVTATGQLKAGIVTNLGTDLKNDHPIGIQYGGGPKGAASTIPAAGTVYTTSLFKDGDFKDAQSAAINGSTVWWVDTTGGTAGSRQKTDMQLYTRADATINGSTTMGVAQPFVECASCHDPHLENVGNANPTFLRISNAGSAVCLACHTK